MTVRLARAALVMLSAGLLSACAGNEAPDEPAVDTVRSPDVTAPSTPVIDSSPEPTSLVLGPDGLGLVSFGAPKSDVLAAIEPLAGPADESGPDCELRGPDSNFVRFDELSLTFDGDTFADYFVRVPPAEAATLDLRTEAGIGLGSTVADLTGVYGDQVQIPGLPADIFGGNDFAVSFPGFEKSLLGSLTDESDNGVITAFFTSVCE